jgi:hypothetical protein
MSLLDATLLKVYTMDPLSALKIPPNITPMNTSVDRSTITTYFVKEHNTAWALVECLIDGLVCTHYFFH